MSNEKMTVVVSDLNGNLTKFALMIHRTKVDDDRRLEIEFYKKNGVVPVGIHHEVEVLSVDPDCGDKRALHLNFHKSERNGLEHVCYPIPVPTTWEVDELIALWTLGITHAVQTRESLNDVIGKLFPNGKPVFSEVIAWYEKKGYLTCLILNS